MFVPTFKILGQVVPEKSLTKNFHINYIGVRDRKKKAIEEGKNKFQYMYLGSVYSHTPGCPHCVNFIENSCTYKC